MSETTAVTEASEPRVYRLTRAELDATAEKVAKLNERAAKKGLNGELTLTFERVEIEDVVAGGIPVTKIFWDTQLHGRAPSFNGWSFIATLDWDAAAGLITRTVPGFEGLIDRSALRANWCDYCNTERQRNETYLLVNTETGERTQVGSTCIKDFLGQHVSPVQFFDAAGSVESDLGGYGGGAAARDYDYTPLSVLAVAWAVIQEFGFVRSNEYGDSTPTKYRVATVLYPPNKGKAREDALALIRKLQPHIDRAKGQAELIRDFILSNEFAGESEYVVNLKAVVAAERVGYRHLGLLVSAPQAWAKAIERDLRRQAEKAELVNEFFGAVKDKVELTVSIKMVSFIDGNYGTTTLTTLYTLVTSDGHLVKWFSSSAALGKDVTTESFRIKATIKGFDEFRETKYTLITRAKVLEVIPAAA